MQTYSTSSVGNQRIKALLYGGSGDGKTYSARSLPEASTLIISAESGLLPLAGTNYTVWVVDEWTDINTIYHELMKKEVQEQYKTIFIDSLTELNELCKEQIVHKDRPKVKGTDVGKVYEDLLTMQDYGLLETRMTRFIRSFRDLPYNVIMTSLQMSVKDEKMGSITLQPSLNGKLASQVGAYFDEVFQINVKPDTDGQVTRFFLTATSGRAIAKDRSGALDTFEAPDWTAIFRKIFAKFNKKENKK